MLVQAIGFGVASGAVIALGAVGLTVQFGVSRAFNVAYGALMTLSAFIAYLFVTNGVNVWLAMVLTVPIAGLATAALNRLIIAPLQRREAGFIGVILGTVYFGLIIQYGISVVAGAGIVTYGRQAGGTVSAGGVTLTAAQIAIIAITVVVMAAFHFVLSQTRFGRALRAVSTNRTLAQACGIRTARVVDLAWLLTGGMCGAAGVALGITVVSFDFSVGSTFFIYMLAAAIVGGVGQPYGAMVGGLFVGIASQIGAAYISPLYQDVVAFGILVIVLLVRPNGLFSLSGGQAGLWET